MTREIPIINSHLLATVDDEDYHKVCGYRWYLKRHRAPTFYTRAYISGRMKLLHQLIIPDEDVPEGYVRSHKDGNGLNNCKANLEVVTHRENLQKKRLYRNNKSGIAGVNFCKTTGRWVVSFQGKRVGRYDSFALALAIRQNLQKGQEKD
jgi:hypothetical protein